MQEKIIIGVIITLLGALIIFLIRRYFFPIKDINGEWDLRVTVKKSTYDLHSGIRIEYKAHLTLQENKISGRGEKIADYKSDGSLHYEYPHVDRIQCDIVGIYKRKYFSKSEINLRFTEYGTERTSSTSQDLKVYNRSYLVGTFGSTVGNSSGDCIWIRLDKDFK
jgi:hypothetical protein